VFPYRETGADNGWRWGKQWLPHSSWYYSQWPIENKRRRNSGMFKNPEAEMPAGQLPRAGGG